VDRAAYLLQDDATQAPIVVDAGQRAVHADQKGVTGHSISVGRAWPGQNPNNLGCSIRATTATLES
jgi:hypothetical protein